MYKYYEYDSLAMKLAKNKVIDKPFYSLYIGRFPGY